MSELAAGIDERALYAEHIAQLSAAYDRLLAAHELDAVVIHSGSAVKRSAYDDQFWPLRPTPHFEHWIALGEPGCLLIKALGQSPRVFWPQCRDFWERPRPAELSHVSSAIELVRLRKAQLREQVPQGRVAFIGEDQAAHAALAPHAARDPEAFLRALDALRVHKSAWEEHCLAQANAQAARGHDAVLASFRDGQRNELFLHLDYLRATAQDDWETPYKNIVALGAHASILHHVGYAKHGKQAGSLLLDAGASYKGYASDITRTWVDGSVAGAELFAALVSAMESLQQQLCAELTLGMPYEDLHNLSHRKLSALLKESGLARGSVESIDEQGISRALYPHGLGHSIGLQCHDVGCALRAPHEKNPFLRNTSVIEERQAFTIEPGIYFIDDLLSELRAGPTKGAVNWSLVDQLTPFGGIRIEDDLVITQQGVRNLTREHLPRGGGALSSL